MLLERMHCWAPVSSRKLPCRTTAPERTDTAAKGSGAFSGSGSVGFCWPVCGNVTMVSGTA